MKTVVLDANYLRRDLMCRGLVFRLLQHMSHQAWMQIYIPRVAFEETVAARGREVDEHAGVLQKARLLRRRLGLAPLDFAADNLDYRNYLTSRLEDSLGMAILPWPTASHEDLVAAALRRDPPFDQQGHGYRDALIWSDVVRLATAGHDVVFVTADSDFRSGGEQLARNLQEEIEAVSGSVTLVKDFATWLLGELPWDAEDLTTAVQLSRQSELEHFVMESDFFDDIFAETESFGFSQSPHSCRTEAVQWSGDLRARGMKQLSHDRQLVDYDMSLDVDFEAEADDTFPIEGDWLVRRSAAPGTLEVSGTVRMILRVAVLYESDGFFIDEVSWRRADGRGAGMPAVPRSRSQPRLF